MGTILDQQAGCGWDVVGLFFALVIRDNHLAFFLLHAHAPGMLSGDGGIVFGRQHIACIDLVFALDLDLPIFGNIVSITD